MNPILKNNLDELVKLCKAYRVDTLYAFGSVCTNKFNKSSDIDFLVSFQPMDYGDYADSYFFLLEKLEELFDRHIDLVTTYSLANPFFIESVDKSKILLYGQPSQKVSA